MMAIMTARPLASEPARLAVLAFRSPRAVPTARLVTSQPEPVTTFRILT